MSNDGGGDVVNLRLDVMQEDIHEIKKSVKVLEHQVTKLAVLESKHAEHALSLNRAFDAIANHDRRIKGVEVEVPLIKLASSWVFKAVIGLVGILGALAIAVIVSGVVK